MPKASVNSARCKQNNKALEVCQSCWNQATQVVALLICVGGRSLVSSAFRGAIVGYIEENLVSGETVVYKTRLHWIVLIWPLVACLVVGGIGLVFVVGGYEARARGSYYPGMIVVCPLLRNFAASVILVTSVV